MPFIDGIGRTMGIELHLIDKAENILIFFVISAYYPDSTTSKKDPELHYSFLGPLLEVYVRTPKYAIIISGEDINSNLGQNMHDTLEDPAHHNWTIQYF